MRAALRADADGPRRAINLTPFGRYGTPEEVASAALSLGAGGVFVGWTRGAS